jgi:DNA-binding GntR family transcriptional regulator
VIKREVMEGERAEEARKKISRAANNALRATSAKVKQADQSKDSDEVPA